MAEDDDKGYTWETEYERTWEALQEDEDGSLQASVDDIVHRAKRRRLLDRPVNVRLGMMRHLFLVVDMSQAMEDQDLKPTRLGSSLKLLEHFVDEYFDQNPISQMGIITTKNKRAEKVTELGGNPKRHITALQGLKNKPCQGEPSLQNTLNVAMQTLGHMPAHASREVLIIFGSLTTCDPGDINESIQEIKNHSIRCSVIGLSAEIRICKKICHETKGKYNVILDEQHFRELLNHHVSPPPASANAESSLIRMGFPHHKLQAGPATVDKPSMCMCHLDHKTGQGFSTSGYFCPQCKSKYCELPVECKACGLTLVSAPHLARSYHHLFPLAAFADERNDQPLPQQKFCFGCQKQLSEPSIFRCNKCSQVFCVDCDVFIHETLHSCPGCASSRKTQHVSMKIQ